MSDGPADAGPPPTEAQAADSGPDPFTRTAVIAGIGLLLALAVTVLVSTRIAPRLVDRPALAFFIQLKLLVSTFNIVVLSALVVIYGRLYRDLPNQFTLSLGLFSLALWLYAVTSNPLVHILFGFRGTPGIGPFAVLPDLFASIAIVVLLYQSYR